MRKLVILTILFSLFSSANAALSWSMDGVTIDLSVSDIAVVRIGSSTSDLYGVWAGSAYSPGDVAKIYDARSLFGGPDPTEDLPGWWSLDYNPDDTPQSGDHWEVTIKGFVTGTYQLSCNYYEYAEWPNDILNVTVVPEPMTIALLGFGALALIRKRR